MKRCLPNKRAGHQISHYPPNFLRQCKRVIPFDKNSVNLRRNPDLTLARE